MRREPLRLARQPAAANYAPLEGFSLDGLALADWSCPEPGERGRRGGSGARRMTSTWDQTTIAISSKVGNSNESSAPARKLATGIVSMVASLLRS
jgi:hypothetical protein